MKKCLGFVLAGILVAGVSVVYAGSACCAAGKASNAAKAKKECSWKDTVAKLDLNEDQKTKLAALDKECSQTSCSYTKRGKYAKGLKEILTPAQLAQCQVECEKQGVKGCPITLTKADKS